MILSFLVGSEIHNQELIFYKEDITFRLTDKYFWVRGDYYFHNQANKSISRLIFYPINCADDEKNIDSISVFNVIRKSEEKILRTSQNGIYFELKIKSNDTTIYHIEYRQKIIGDSVQYILTTTQNWKQPLEIAEYKLLVENPVEIKSLSYKPDDEYKIQGKKIYYWRRGKFIPDKDMIIHFTVDH